MEFYNPDDIISSIEKEVVYKQTHITKRNGNSISLRPIVYNCIREVYFEVMDCPKNPSEDGIKLFKSFFWTGPIGDALHQKFQNLMHLTEQPYTEELVTFETFAPLLYVRSKCDGIDVSNPDNIVLYEIKTKDSIPSKPYDGELLQCLLSVFFFRKEINLNIKGASMIYVNRSNPYDFKFFNYDFFDTLSEYYINVVDALHSTFQKIQELLNSLQSRTPPSMESKFVKKFDYGKPKCPNCVYREVCSQYK